MEVKSWSVLTWNGESCARLHVIAEGAERNYEIRHIDGLVALVIALQQAAIEANGFKNIRITLDKVIHTATQVGQTESGIMAVSLDKTHHATVNPAEVANTCAITLTVTVDVGERGKMNFRQITDHADQLEEAIIQAFLKAMVELGH